jgi:hypothetical protein
MNNTNTKLAATAVTIIAGTAGLVFAKGGWTKMGVFLATLSALGTVERL